MSTDPERLAQRCASVLPLTDARLPDDYFYASLPLCVIDAVFSIGVRYEGVRNVVARYCERTQTPRFRDRDKPLPKTQETASKLVARLEGLNARIESSQEAGTRAADELFGNRQRTASRNGILKAEAVRRFAAVLGEHKVERLEDVPGAMSNPSLDAAVRSIPGQGSGLSLAYFWMLAGSDDHVKPDRMVLRFLADTLGRPESKITQGEAQDLLGDAVVLLRRDYSHLTPRLLDHLIWGYQRDVPTPKPALLSETVLAFLPEIEAEGFVAHWREAGYPIYHPTLLSLLRSVDSVNPYVTLPEDSPGAEPVRILREEAAMARAIAGQILRYLAQLMRGERFGDGYIAGEFDQGRILVALRRLRDVTIQS